MTLFAQTVARVVATAGLLLGFAQPAWAQQKPAPVAPPMDNSLWIWAIVAVAAAAALSWGFHGMMRRRNSNTPTPRQP